MNTEMRNLTGKRIQVDEIWAYVPEKQRTSGRRVTVAVLALSGRS